MQLPLQDVIASCSNMSDPRSADDLSFSGWQSVSSTRAQTVILDLDTFEEDLINIYFATRMAEGSNNNDYAWAYFSKIRISEGASLRSEAAE